VSRKRKGKRRINRIYLAIGFASLVFAIVLILRSGSPGDNAGKPVILYVNQGNGIVDESNFASMLSFCKSRGFNSVFFQVYRQGHLLFSTNQLEFFVVNSHSRGVPIFFALYITNSSQELPASIFGLGEDGISLDMSTLPSTPQADYLSNLRTIFHSGQIAITTTNFNTSLKPDLLVFETYGAQAQGFIRHGIVASVGVFATVDSGDYQQQFRYAFDNSDGVMVFDYAGLVKRGY
jgi:hypothetical protein